MSTPSNLTHHSDHDQVDPSRPAVVDRVQTALDGLRAQVSEVYATRPSTNADHAQRAMVLALLHARCAGWWRVLSRAGYRDAAVPRPFACAAVIAHGHAQDRARFWRDTAADWRARAEHRPTSDAAGALSNWHELGVTA